jgi:peptidylprolyl isomerase
MDLTSRAIWAACVLLPALAAQIPEVAGKATELATLRYIDIKPGDGADAASGKEFTVHYTGWLRDGTQFDSSVGREPLKFVQGRRQVIPGFDAGFEGMKVGGKRRIVIPYQLAYGEQQRGKIPPRSELTFDVELVAVNDASPNGGPTADLLLPFSDLETKVVDLAKAIPEDKYDYRPGPGVRSVREVCLHIAYGNQLLMNISNGIEKNALYKQIQDQIKREGEKLTKEQVVQILTDSFKTTREALQSASTGSLSRDIDFFGRPTTRRGVLTVLDVHIGEHMGQLIAYARMVGVVPPWSK